MRETTLKEARLDDDESYDGLSPAAKATGRSCAMPSAATVHSVRWTNSHGRGKTDALVATKYVPGLDGLRGLAILMVLLFHAGRLPMGWIGVQIFFVLSGFLITRILLEQREATIGRSLKRFWWRRSLRILPIYILYVALLGIIWTFWSRPAHFGENFPYLATYTLNFARLMADTGNSRAYNHIWSLCVEEQFYLVWPFVAWLLPRRCFVAIVFAMLGFGPLIRAICYWHYYPLGGPALAAEVCYYSSLSHIDAFAWGAAVVVAPAWMSNRNRLAAVAALLAMFSAYCICKYDAPIMSLGFPRMAPNAPANILGYSLIGMASASVVALVATADRAAPFLTNRALVKLGRISYGLYLYHNAVFLALSSYFPWNSFRFGYDAMVLLYLVISLALAGASFILVERPILALKDCRIVRMQPKPQEVLA